MRACYFLTLIFTLLSSSFLKAAEVVTLNDAAAKKTTNLNPEYLVIAPERKDSTAKLPLMIHLHGAGGDGRNIRKVQKQIERLQQALQKFDHGSCILVAPQCLTRPPKSDDSWLAVDLNAFLEDVKAKFPVDEARIYLTGTSMGGYGSWMWGGTNPEHFAGIAPIVGGIGPGGPKDVTPDLEKWAVNLAKVPVWAFAGGLDRVVPAERSERLFELIKEKGGTAAKLTVYPEEGHGAGRRVYESKEFFDWLFGQSRK